MGILQMFTLSSRQCHCVNKCNAIGLSSLCIATVCVPKVESGEQADKPKVELGEQRVKLTCVLLDGCSVVVFPGDRDGIETPGGEVDELQLSLSEGGLAAFVGVNDDVVRCDTGDFIPSDANGGVGQLLDVHISWSPFSCRRRSYGCMDIFL